MEFPSPKELESIGWALQPPTPERTQAILQNISEIIDHTVPLSTTIESQLGEISIFYDYKTPVIEHKSYRFEPRMSLGYDSDKKNWMFYLGFDKEDPWVKRLKRQKKESLPVHSFYPILLRGLPDLQAQLFPKLQESPITYTEIHTATGDHQYMIAKPLSKIDFLEYTEEFLGPVVTLLSNRLNTGEFKPELGFLDTRNWKTIETLRNTLANVF